MINSVTMETGFLSKAQNRSEMAVLSKATPVARRVSGIAGCLIVGMKSAFALADMQCGCTRRKQALRNHKSSFVALGVAVYLLVMNIFASVYCIWLLLALSYAVCRYYDTFCIQFKYKYSPSIIRFIY